MRAWFVSPKGFGLLEVVVAVGIFVTTITVLTGILINTDRLGRRTERGLTQARDVRSMIDFMTREFRRDEVDWPAYGANGPQGVQSRLALRRSDDDRTRIVFLLSDATTAALCGAAAPCLIFGQDLDHDGVVEIIGGEAASLHGLDFSVNDFSVYLNPTRDPLVVDDRTAAVVPNEQPRATITLETAGTGGLALERVPQRWQTTMTSRLYRR